MVTQKTHMNENISFLRIRPCDNNNEIYLNSRRKEGTSAFLIKSELELDINEIHKKDFQTLSKNAGVDSDCWIINDNNWKNFIGTMQNSINKSKLNISLNIILITCIVHSIKQSRNKSYYYCYHCSF